MVETENRNASGYIRKMSEEDPVFGHCQWIHGDGRDREFCRKPVDLGEVWCGYHREQVFLRGSVRDKILKRMKKNIPE